MRVTTWTEYSLIISLHLARRGRGAGEPVAARELADSERLPADYVEQILLRLRRAGLVESVRGAKGGYYLARDPSAISVSRCDDRLGASDFRGELRDPPGGRRAVSPGHRLQHPPGLACAAAAGDDLLAASPLPHLMKQEDAGPGAGSITTA